MNHYLTSGAKMSASRGVGFSLDEGIDRIGVDPLRHALCALNPETADVEFTWEQADALTRTGLLRAIANPVYRVASLLGKRFGGRAHPAAWPEAVDERKEAARAVEEIGSAIRGAELRRALAGVSAVKVAFIQIMSLTSDSFLLPVMERHPWLTI